MIDVFQLYDEFCGTVNSAQGGHIRPHRNFLAWVKTINLDIFKDFYKKFQETQFIADEMAAFQKYANVLVKETIGQLHDTVILSEDYKYFVSAAFKVHKGEIVGVLGGDVLSENSEGICCKAIAEEDICLKDSDDDLTHVPIEKVTSNRWNSLSQRLTLKPSLINPYCTQFDKGFKIQPKGIGIIVMDYFRKPVDPTFNYTVINAGTEDEYIQYDTSTPLEWGDTMRGEFIARLTKKYATMKHQSEMYQIGAAEIKE